MNRWLNGLAVGAGMAAALPVLLAAQWPQFPAGTPTPATAPTPRTADGKPDLSGNWIRGDGLLGPAGGGTLPGPAPTFSSGPPVTTFRDVAANPKVAFVVDDVLPPWQPRSVMIQGSAEALESPDSGEALIRITPRNVISWGLGSAG